MLQQISVKKLHQVFGARLELVTSVAHGSLTM